MFRPLRNIVCLLVLVALAPTTTVADESAADGSASGLDLEAFRGKVVYLDFWASWCTPCRQSFPWMIDLQDRLEARGLAVVTVNVDRDRKAADRFLAELDSDLPVIYDPEGEIAERYQLDAMPSSFVYDRNGELHETHLGFHPSKIAEVEAQLEALLAAEVDDAEAP